MVASLTWLDHDFEARERSLRLISSLQQEESRDELGIGGIRDSIADQLFPGTSTIHTRLRYMLFVPWIYSMLEQDKVPSSKFAIRADIIERELIEAMVSVDEIEEGAFGIRTGSELKRLPSSVYWSGLGAWNIRKKGVSQYQYCQQIEKIYNLRRAQKGRIEEAKKNGDSDEETFDETVTWHPKLPEPPENFPNMATFKLTKEEANFLKERILLSNSKSLLAFLASNCSPAKINFPWEHPDFSSFRDEHKELLNHARIFSKLIHGAALIYNIELCKKDKNGRWDDMQAIHEGNFAIWLNDINLNEIRTWSVNDLWSRTRGMRYKITCYTKNFVEQWVDLLVTENVNLENFSDAAQLIIKREQALKKNKSRFNNCRAFNQWNGSSGLKRLNYRWLTASTFLHDLYYGLHPEKN